MKNSGKRRWLVVLAGFLAVAALCLPAAVRADAFAGTVASASRRTGKAAVVLKKKNGSLYGYRNGKALKNRWETVKGARYYFGKKGAAVTGSVKISGVWYVFGSDGKLQTPKATSVIRIGKKYYRVSKTGKAAPGWDAKKVYYYGKNGLRVTDGWSADKKYYLDSRGKKLTGIRVISRVVKDEYGLESVAVTFYAFGSDGKKNGPLTKKLQAAAVEEKDFAVLKALIGNPVSAVYERGCTNGPWVNGKQPYAGGDDGVLKYKNFIVYTYKAPTGEEFFMDVITR